MHELALEGGEIELHRAPGEGVQILERYGLHMTNLQRRQSLQRGAARPSGVTDAFEIGVEIGSIHQRASVQAAASVTVRAAGPLCRRIGAYSQAAASGS